MSKSGESQLHNVREPSKWITSSNPFKVRKSSRKSQVLIKHFRVTSAVLVLLYTLLAASFFYMISFWFSSIDYADLLPKYELIQDSKSPAIVWYTLEVSQPSNKEISCLNGSRLSKCDVYMRQSQPDDPDAYLFYAPLLEQFPLPRDSNVLWGLLHDESPLNNLVFMQEKALNLFNFSATFSRHSDVPFPLMAMRGLDTLTSTRYFVKTLKKNNYLSTLAPVMYLQSDTYTSTNRDSYVEKLMQFIQIDSYGSCLHNKNLPINKIYTDPALRDIYIYRYNKYMYDPDLLQFIGRYKFFISIENAVCDDYVTEKLWRALEVGVVPIYFGSPLIRDWLPNNKSAVLVEDYPTPELLSQHLHYLLQNDTAYEDYLLHKILGQISNQKLINEIRLRPYENNMTTIKRKFECFICEKLHNKNNNYVNVMTKKQFDCPPSVAALSPTTPGDFTWRELIHGTLTRINNIYEELRNPDLTIGSSNTSWRE